MLSFFEHPQGLFRCGCDETFLCQAFDCHDRGWYHLHHAEAFGHSGAQCFPELGNVGTGGLAEVGQLISNLLTSGLQCVQPSAPAASISLSLSQLAVTHCLSSGTESRRSWSVDKLTGPVCFSRPDWLAVHSHQTKPSAMASQAQMLGCLGA